MIIKIVTFFLIAMLVLGMFGKLRAPSLRFKKSVKCKACGSPLVGRGACPCGRQR